MSSNFDLIRESQRSLDVSASEIQGALVYVDEAFVETARDAWGMKELLERGAVNVCSLENAAPQDVTRSEVLVGEPIDKVAIFTGKLLHESYPEILRLLTDISQSVRSCTVFTSMSEETYSLFAPPDMRLYPFESYREKLQSQLHDLLKGTAAEAHFQVEIKACPLSFSPHSAKVFTIPVPSSLRRPLREEVDVANAKLYEIDDFDLSDYEEDLSPGLTFLARSVSEMCSNLGWDTHIYAQGRISKVLAREVASMVQRRGKQTRQDVSLILLDRALDLVTPLCHADSDLERLSRGSTAATAGSLAQPSDSTAVGWFELLCSQRAKGASFTIKKELKQALLEEQVPNKVGSKLGTVSLNELSSLRSCLDHSGVMKQKYASLLQYADLVMEGLDPQLLKKSEFLIAVERIVEHLALDGPDMPLQYLVELVTKVKDKTFDLLSLGDIVRLTCISHILVSLKFGDSGQHLNGDLLQDFLTDLFLSMRMQAAGEESADEESVGPGVEEEIGDKVKTILQRLNRATSVCCTLNRESKSLLALTDKFKPLMSSILELESFESKALEYMPASIGGLLASGLGRRFGFKSKPKISDSDIVVVFILGDVSQLEIKLALTAAESGQKGQTILLGSLDVTSPGKFILDLIQKYV